MFDIVTLTKHIPVQLCKVLATYVDPLSKDTLPPKKSLKHWWAVVEMDLHIMGPALLNNLCTTSIELGPVLLGAFCWN